MLTSEMGQQATFEMKEATSGGGLTFWGVPASGGCSVLR